MIKRLAFVLVPLAIISSSLAIAFGADVGGNSRLIRMSPDVGGSVGNQSPELIFDATFDTSGPSQLSDTLTVGSSTLELMLACDRPSVNINSGKWTCRKDGGTIDLNETGTSTSPELVSGPWSDGYKFARVSSTAYNHFSSSDSSLDIGTEDFAVELVYRQSTGSGGCVGKKTGVKNTVDKGWQIVSSGASYDNPYLYVSDGTTLTSISAYTNNGGWDTTRHIICFVGRSGANLTQCFTNGVAGASASSTNTLGTISSNSNFTLLRATSATGNICGVAAFRLWKCTSCLTNASLYTPIAEDRSERLMGIRPDISVGTATLESHSRSSAYSYHRTYDADSGSTVYSQVGPGWMRVETLKIGNDVIKGFLSERARTNIALQSNAISNATWTKTGMTASGNTNPGPSNETPNLGDTVNVTGAGTSEFTQSKTVSTSTTYTDSQFVKRIDSSSPQWVALTATNVATCSANQSLLAWFDITNCTIGQLGTDGIVSHATNLGNGWCRVDATFATSATATACLLGLRVVDSNGATSWTGATSGVSLYVWHHQTEAGFFATSPIDTGSSSVAFVADALRFNGSNVTSIGSSPVTIESKMNCPDRATLATTATEFIDIGDGTGTNNHKTLAYQNSAPNVPRYVANVGNVSQADIAATTKWYTGNITLRTTAEVNNFKLYVNGSVEASDTSGSLFSSWQSGHFVVGGTIAPTTNAPNCTFDRIRIWKGVATPAVYP